MQISWLVTPSNNSLLNKALVNHWMKRSRAANGDFQWEKYDEGSDKNIKFQINIPILFNKYMFISSLIHHKNRNDCSQPWLNMAEIHTKYSSCRSHSKYWFVFISLRCLSNRYNVHKKTVASCLFQNFDIQFLVPVIFIKLVT